MSPALLSLVVIGAAGAARAAEFTAITVDPPVPAAPRYSQAVALTIHLTRAEDGTAVGRDECGQPCRVVVSVAPAGDPAAAVTIFDPAIDTEGTATTRLTFVDGRYDDDSAFPAGAIYVVTARFAGTASPGSPQCAPGAAPEVNGDLCPSEASVEVPLAPETAEIDLGLGVEGALGDTIVLSAELRDPNGLATEGGTAVDGPGALDLAGAEVRFFYDQDNDGNAEASEALDADPATAGVQPAITNAAGVASMSFLLDPQFVRAGEYELGIQAEFGGNGRYGVARAGARLIVGAADVDIGRTIISPQPASIPADGVSRSRLVITLVDAFNNPLGPNAAASDVVITTDLGRLLEEVARDPVSGTYSQELQAQLRAGTANIGVTVDGVAAGTTTVELTGENGCQCASVSAGPIGVVGVALLWRRRRRAASLLHVGRT